MSAYEDYKKYFDNPELSFDERFTATEVFKYLRLGCKYLSKQFEYAGADPVLTFCNHPHNESDVEGNCNTRRCPLLR